MVEKIPPLKLILSDDELELDKDSDEGVISRAQQLNNMPTISLQTQTMYKCILSYGIKVPNSELKFQCS